jgi:hypothetical protein
MDVLLTECTEEQKRSVIIFLRSEDVKTREIYGRIAVKYGDNSSNHREVWEWVGIIGG